MATKTQPKTVLITGCSNGGMGSALATEFQSRGYIVFAGVRSLAKGSDLAALPNVTLLNLDVTSKDSIAKAVKDVEKATEGKGLDVLINNAGHGAPGPVVDVDLEFGRKMFEVNFWGALEMIQAFSPLIVRTKGTIVNISSLGALLPPPYLSLYGSSKAALKIASDTLRMEMKPFGVRVITGMVGLVRTKFGENLSDVILPDDSLFKPVESFINDSPGGQRGKMEDKKMPVEEFSRKLVGDILAGKSGPVYRGGMSSMSYFMHMLVPGWILEWMIVQGCGLDKLYKSKSG